MSGCAKGKVLKTFVVRAAVFANRYLTKLGSNPGTKIETQALSILIFMMTFQVDGPQVFEKGIPEL